MTCTPSDKGVRQVSFTGWPFAALISGLSEFRWAVSRTALTACLLTLRLTPHSGKDRFVSAEIPGRIVTEI